MDVLCLEIEQKSVSETLTKSDMVNRQKKNIQSIAWIVSEAEVVSCVSRKSAIECPCKHQVQVTSGFQSSVRVSRGSTKAEAHSST